MIKHIYGTNIDNSHRKLILDTLENQMTDSEYMLYKSRASNVIYILEKYIPYIKNFIKFCYSEY